MPLRTSEKRQGTAVTGERKGMVKIASFRQEVNLHG